MDRAVRIGVLTVSDRASRGEYEDRSGPAVREYLGRVLTTEHDIMPRIVVDEAELIARELVELADAGCCLVITTGGTGPAPRDVTPSQSRSQPARSAPITAAP